jgi:hypothetical protein
VGRGSAMAERVLDHGVLSERCPLIRRFVSLVAVAVLAMASPALFAADNTAPEGFTTLFNGKDLSGWYGLGTYDLRKLAAMTAEEKTKFLDEQLATMKAHWKVENGELVNDGQGAYMTTEKDYGDFELLVEFKLIAKGDSGVYLKATPQVQIWDTTEQTYWKMGADKGSGGLWNNGDGSSAKHPLVKADKAIGEWNQFRIVQVGARTTVSLNGKLVVDHGILENYFDKKGPLFAKGPVQLQTHGNEVRWKNIYIREIPAAEANAMLAKKGDDGYAPLFDGSSLAGWAGAVDNYEVVDGAIRCKQGKGGVLHTEKEYSDFAVRLEFKLPPAGNNGLAIRYPGKGGDPAYMGMCELQVLDNEDPKYAKLDPRQYHGSAYGLTAAPRGYQRPVGEWNFQEVTVVGSTVKVELNGNVILNTDLATVKEFMANTPHPGKDLTSGFFGFAGHGDAVAFRNVRIKSLAK